MDHVRYLFVIATFYAGVLSRASNDCSENGVSQTYPVQPTRQQRDENDIPHEPFTLSNHHVGRHVCRYEKVIMKPHQERESYCKPTYLTYLRKCEGNKQGLCTEYRLVYELVHRNVQKMMPETEVFFECCPGWSRARLSARSCKKAICVQECQNGGSCLKPNRCACLPGWTGKFCQKDIDECEKKPRSCDQICINWPGSFKCSCHEGFLIESDGKTCKKTTNMIYEESSWMKQYEKLSARITEIEKQLAVIDDLGHRVQILTEDIEYLKNQTAEQLNPVSEDHGLGRINSLSEQMAIIEERLAECSCNSAVKTPLRRPPG